MMEFLLTMVIITTVFITATVLVALAASFFLRLRGHVARREARKAIPE